MIQEFDYLFKTVIVGDSSVGKTQMMLRFINNQFSTQSKPTVGVEFGTKTVQIGQYIVKNQIWDTAGQDRFRALTCSYYRGAIGAIVTFDLSRAITFQHVQKWITEIRDNCEQNVSILLVGNKNDILQKQVSDEQIENYAMDNKLLYVSTSANTGENIQFAFHSLIKCNFSVSLEILHKLKPEQIIKKPIPTNDEVEIPIPEIELNQIKKTGNSIQRLKDTAKKGKVKLQQPKTKKPKKNCC